MPTISVIVPVYKVEKYIHRCIDSILNQTFADFELILVDDGSPDNSGSICDACAEKDGRIRVIHQENAGVSAARNTGIEASQGDYIAFVDSDDYIAKDYLETLYRFRCDLTICGRNTYDQENNLLGMFAYDSKKYTDKKSIDYPGMYRTDMLYSPCCILFRGSIIRQYGLRFQPQITWGEDSMFVADYLVYVSSVEILPYRGYFYIKYYSGNNLSTVIRYNILDMITTSREHCVEKIKEHAPHAYDAVKQICTEDICFSCVNFFGRLLRGNMKNAEKLILLSHFLENGYVRRAMSNPTKYFIFDNLVQRAVTNCNDAKEILTRYKLLCIKKTIKKCLVAVYNRFPPAIKNAYHNVKLKMRKCKKILRAPGKLKKNMKRILTREIAGFRCMKVNEVDREIALNTISQLHEKAKMPFAQKTAMDIGYDLMIIVPVYNAEAFLRQCVDTILNQKTQYTYVAVFIDDGSTDQSGKILDEYALRDNVRVIHQENRGHSGARNRALETLLGRYVMFVDSDDYISDNTVELLMTEAYKHDADVVEGGLVYFSEDREYGTEAHSQRGIVNGGKCLTGYPCCKAIRSNLFSDLCFPQGIWFEDTIIKTLLYPKCQVFVTVPEIIYHYRKNPNSISHTCREDARCLDTFWITKFYLEEMKYRNYSFGPEEYEHFLLQCRRNHQRTENMAPEVRESVFVLECELWEEYFLNVACPEDTRLLIVERALRNNNYGAFCYIQDHWTEM